MKKIVFFWKLIRIALSTLFYGSITIISPKRKQIGHFHTTARKWAKSLLRIAAVELQVDGVENISLDENYVFVSNHQSLFDIPVLILAIPHDFRIIYKKELEKVPFFGYVLKKSPYIGIVREDNKDAMKGLKQALDEFQKGASVLIFPEGTRSEDANLQPFKRGAFMLATKSLKSIVPIAVLGTKNILPKGKKYFAGGFVKVIFDKPIPVPIKTNKQVELDLQNTVHQIIDNILKTNRK